MLLLRESLLIRGGLLLLLLKPFPACERVGVEVRPFAKGHASRTLTNSVVEILLSASEHFVTHKSGSVEGTPIIPNRDRVGFPAEAHLYIVIVTDVVEEES